MHRWSNTPASTKRADDRRYDRLKRDEDAAEFYRSKDWQKLRDLVYKRDMATCQVCGNVTANRKIVDHIIARKIAPELAMDADNLWVLCFQCHNIKTRIEAEKVRKRRGKQLRSFGRNWWKNVIKARL